MRYATLCSGIEACSSAWHPLGFEPVFFSEIEPFPKAVLKHHYPNVPDLGDMTLYQDWKDYGTIDLICAGTPCQAFSVAGLREGLADPRGNLTLVFLGVLAKYRPKWVVWENVPGVLSDRSNAFGQFVAGLSELGYGVAWRVLDAQYFGVAQRRRRVFVVGCLGDWRASAAVLFDPHSLSGHPAPSRKTWQGTTGSAAFSAGNSGEARGVGYTEEGTPPLRAGASGTNQVPTVAHAFKVCGEKEGGGKGYLCQDEQAFTISTGQDQVLAQPIVLNDQGGGVMNIESKGVVGTLRRETHGHEPIVMQAIPLDLRNAGRDAEKHDAMNRQGLGVGEPGDPANTLSSAYCHGVATPIEIGPSGMKDVETSPTLDTRMSDGPRRNQIAPAVLQSMAIRRITPTEAERLQGFSDGHTNIPWRGKSESPDGPRYKALGNSMAVYVMRWIGERIKDIDDYMKARGA